MLRTNHKHTRAARLNADFDEQLLFILGSARTDFEVGFNKIENAAIRLSQRRKGNVS